MGGGIIQLVAYGLLDLFLTSDPQITFFKIVYRRYTNFSTETIPQSFNIKPNFGKRITAVLSRTGDLIGNIHLVAVLPRIPEFKDKNGEIDNLTKFAWVKRIGFALIKRVEVEIGGELIDRQYGDWLNIWYELTIPNNKNLNKILGDVKELTDFTNGKKSYKLFIPLQFWFNRVAGLALPVISLQYNHVKINIELNDFKKCFILAPTHYIELADDLVNLEPFEYIIQQKNSKCQEILGQFVDFDILTKRMYFIKQSKENFSGIKVDDETVLNNEENKRKYLYKRNSDGKLKNGSYLIKGLTSLSEVMPKINSKEKLFKGSKSKLKNISLKDAFLLVDYYYLDSDERVRFLKSKHEYLIEQLLYDGEKTIDSINRSYKIGFTHPCKELFWVSQLAIAEDCRINDLFNYTDSLIKDKNGNPIGKNIIKKETILFNGLERLSFRDSRYFTQVQPYQYHRHNPSEGINIYSFSLYPEKYQPAGSANLTRIDNVNLRIKVDSTIGTCKLAKLRIYGLVYNILRISGGISGLVFANDIFNY